MKTFMKLNRILAIFILILNWGVNTLTAGERPMIQADASDKTRVLGLIEKYGWAADALERMRDGVSEEVAAHMEDPAAAMQAAPSFGKDGVHAHIGWMNHARIAGTLYFLTDNDDYAQFAADRLNGYVQYLGVDGTAPIVSSHGRQRDYRDVHDKIGLSYDYIYSFLTQPGTTVFDALSGKRIPFDDVKAQIMFSNIVEYGFKTSERGNNLEIMIFDALLYCALCIEDNSKCDAYVDTLVKGWGHDAGLLNMKKVMMANRGILPESSSYGGVGESVPVYMEIIDRLYPEYKIFDGYEEALLGVAQRWFFDYPNGNEMLAFGDSRRRIPEGIRSNDRFNQVIRRAGFDDVAKLVFGKIKADREFHGYQPDDLWTMDPLEEYEALPVATQSLHLLHAGLAMQNNLHCTDPAQHGLMYYTAGGSYVHSQLSGLDLELYGAGNVMSGVGSVGDPWVNLPGVGNRNTFRFVTYYRNYAGHNTVVINGESIGANKGWRGYDHLWMNTVKLQAMEPMPFTPAVSKQFTFSSQQLEDTINDATQQRTVSIVRTSETTGYYFDMFRSRSHNENRFHDYIYRNIGDALTLKSADGTELSLTPDKPVERTFETFTYTDWERFSSRPLSPPENRDYPLLFPGWHFFSDVAFSEEVSEPVVGRFDITAGNQRYMHVAMPGGVKREYTSATAPTVSEAVAPYDNRPARILSIRQHGEAWNQPFILIYEPSANEQPTVQSVENILDGDKVVGVKVVSNVNGKVITDRIIARDDDGDTYVDTDNRLSFTGRFAIIRTIDSPSCQNHELYIGEGKELTFQGYQLVADDGKAFRLVD